MTFSAKYDKDGTITAGPFPDGHTWSNITSGSRYYLEVMSLTNDGADIEPYMEPEQDQNYTIGKSTPWRRMTDAEAETVSSAIKQQTMKMQMIYDAAAYIDTRDELFGTLKALLTSLFSAKRADELLARET
jgi:hypothetical protein